MKHPLFLEVDKAQNLYSGLGQFCLHLGKAIEQLSRDEFQISYAGSKKLGKAFGEDTSYLQLNKLNRLFAVTAPKKSIWHCMHQDSPYAFPSKSKVVFTVHDLNFLEKYKHKFKLKRRLKLLQEKVNKADAIVAISQYTANVLQQHIDLKGKPVQVIYNGCNWPKDLQFTKPNFEIKGKFLFSIGVLQARKNFKALLPLLTLLPEYQLVIAGHKSAAYYDELIQAAKSLNVLDSLILPGTISESEKWWLYEHCQAFVFPSLSEGFGLPVIEAMSLGKAVVLANATCLPEIGGNGAFYWSDFEPEHMVAILKEAITHTDAQKNTAWAKQFSWQQAADQYLKVYKSLV